jgi:membrane protease YdiL (CAAX protease family)
VLEPPGNFHSPASRRPTLSLKGRASPRLYALGLAVGLPGIAALLLYLVALGAGIKLPGGPVPRWLVLEVVCVAAAVGAIGCALAQGRQRRADAWRDYDGPSPLPMMAALLAIVTALEVPLEAGLNAARVDLQSGLATLLLLTIFLGAYVGLVHFLALHSHALTWRDIARPARLAPGSDDWDTLEPVPGWTRRWGESIGAWRARVSGSRLGDILVALAMVAPLILASNLLSGAMLQVLGLRLSDVTGPGSYTPTNDVDRLLMFIAVAIVAPLGEEIFFRGFATNAWGRSLGRGATMIRGSLFFAFIHVLNTATTDVGVFWRVALFNFGARIPVAVALTWLYMRRRSILASGALHATYNGIITVISFF